MRKYSSPEWKVFRAKVLKRDNYTCQRCGSKSFLHVHEKKYTKPFKLKNCVTLCDTCHLKCVGHGRLKNLVRARQFMAKWGVSQLTMEELLWEFGTITIGDYLITQECPGSALEFFKMVKVKK